MTTTKQHDNITYQQPSITTYHKTEQCFTEASKLPPTGAREASRVQCPNETHDMFVTICPPPL
eukprot:4637291-Pyramimonas_sp.AAC.1